VTLGGEEYAVRLVVQAGPAMVYTLDSLDGAVVPAINRTLRTMMWLGLAAFGVAGLASLWTARTLARPIDTLSRSLAEMTRSRSFESALPTTGSSLEVDALTRTFNSMMESVSAAEAETQSTYVGAIRALAMALDARDPYTAGHSERVSAISVAVGRQMGLAAQELEVLRLGALLHDIGKIGISDNVLRKPEGLTAEEFELIKEHPTLGARMLRTVPFLAQHLPIVELHHERPDGKGYPHGFTADEIPMLARIVHVADAFDAMTSARAYRPALDSGYAVRELWRCAGTQFDAEVVQALVQAVTVGGPVTANPEPEAEVAALAAPRRLALVPSRS
jgi:putative nucleotidyltransferase with HDIG domain